ncbi:Uma2 family endonuclease [Crocosphaera sp. XPORK-15E]|uniref:Uma2 family endonuclease n=1 Tax=Crocosphaera sp. XPORK-15E TaxID=3110247 RepID=UPI002B1F5ECD|nr:Uma2 family endonuclease [Crocosphaera sp. XPORK-15E]MEA5535670.1 Uma2 family endonuclease [Crocosphaera sp. XPORK-15E]
MEFTTDRPYTETSLPDHTQLPDSDGTFVKNWQEHPQSLLLTASLTPILKQLHPNGDYCIGQDLGIYWRIIEPPERGAQAPDWFYVPNVPATLNGKTRRSYVLWQEYISPLIALEFVSGNGEEERDKTPWKGKFWIYEQVIKPGFYGIYEASKASLEMYELIGGTYELLSPNQRGHYAIKHLNVEIGLWQGEYQNVELPWLRWWDLEGNLLLDGDERAELERQKSDRLMAQLRALGVEPEL